MPDLLVKLYDLPRYEDDKRFEQEGIVFKKAHILDKQTILDFIGRNFAQGWVNECEAALTNHPSTCFIAVKNKEVIGFSCYEATGKGFFGPIGVVESERGKGIGKALLFRCLNAMKDMGYAYAIIGWVGSALKFYQKEVNAMIIEGSTPEKSIYQNMIRF